ncbi:unnamed protein product [Brassica oleracea var. botrytis]
MSSSHRGSASSSRQRGRIVSNETRTRSTDRFKWTYEQEKKLIELFDLAISTNKYTLKDPTALGRDYIVGQFNLAFNMNITYGFFKNKLDEFKKSYKMWKFLMKSTGISVDPETSMIYASPEWWDNHEAGCRLTKSFNREPPKFWDIMLESILEEVNNVGDVRVVHTLVADEGVVCIDQVEAQELMLEVVHEEVGENNHLRQQCKKLLLGLEIFNDKVYNNFFLAEALFLDLQVTKHTKFYWKCLNTLQDTYEDKLQLLEAMTCDSRNNEDISKQLDLIMEMTNQPERIQLMFNMNFRWTIIMKFQIAQQKELRLIPNNHNHPVLAFRICQLRSQSVHNLSYEERVELWNMKNEQFEELVIQPSLNYFDQNFQRAPQRTGRGLGWRNIWNRLQEDDAACLQLLRMSLPCFTALCNILQTNYGLQPTSNISIEESVAIFLVICGHNEVQRDVGLRFGRNQETVMRKFSEVLTATELLACDYIRTPTTQELQRISERLLVDRVNYPYISGCVGAMDGTHVCVKVTPELQGMYWNRHDNASLNIMAICDFNMLFTYIWNGAPGSCHDTAVLTMAKESDSEFPMPPLDKYYLVVSGYPNKQGFLAPYRSSRNRL